MELFVRSAGMQYAPESQARQVGSSEPLDAHAAWLGHAYREALRQVQSLKPITDLEHGGKDSFTIHLSTPGFKYFFHKMTYSASVTAGLDLDLK